MAMDGHNVKELKRLITDREMRVHYSNHSITDEEGSLSLPITVYHPVNSPALMGWEYYAQFGLVTSKQYGEMLEKTEQNGN